MYSNNGLTSSPSTVIISQIDHDFHPSDLFTIFSQTKLSFSPNTAFHYNVRVIDEQQACLRHLQHSSDFNLLFYVMKTTSCNSVYFYCRCDGQPVAGEPWTTHHCQGSWLIWSCISPSVHPSFSSILSCMLSLSISASSNYALRPGPANHWAEMMLIVWSLTGGLECDSSCPHYSPVTSYVSTPIIYIVEMLG